MPTSKKPRKPQAVSKTKASVGPGLPDRRAMEAYLAVITGDGREDAIARAQEVMYDAWDSTTSHSRVALARKALEISPLCADAYNLLAEETARSTPEVHDLYERAVKAGELALGPEGFREYEGHFWGFLETRPYMRARHGLALTLLKLGNEEAAIGHFRAMLTLNPNDNQGIRYLLLGSLLRRDDRPGLEALLAEYPDEWSVYWLYTRLLLAYRREQTSPTAIRAMIKDALSANAHVPAILAGTRQPVPSSSGYVTLGGADEATNYVRECGAAWHETPGAIQRLVTDTSAQPKRRPRKTIH